MSGRSVAIRESIVERLTGFGDYASDVRRVLVPQLQPESIPNISVAVVSEELEPDGDSNVGEPRFVSTIVIGIALVRKGNDTSVTDGQIDSDIEDALEKLLTDATFVTFGPAALFESVERVSSRRSYPQEGQAYFCVARVEMTFRTRISFEPVIPDHYKGMTITARPTGHPDAPAIVKKIDEADWT